MDQQLTFDHKFQVNLVLHLQIQEEKWKAVQTIIPHPPVSFRAKATNQMTYGTSKGKILHMIG